MHEFSAFNMNSADMCSYCRYTVNILKRMRLKALTQSSYNGRASSFIKNKVNIFFKKNEMQCYIVYTYIHLYSQYSIAFCTLKKNIHDR